MPSPTATASRYGWPREAITMHRIIRAAAHVAIPAVLALCSNHGAGHHYGHQPHHGKPAPVRTGTPAPPSQWDDVSPVDYPACPDDSGDPTAAPCKWDAARMGNGTGQSFYIDLAGSVNYVPSFDRSDWPTA